MNEELKNVRKRISILEYELSQLKKKEVTLSQVSDPPDIVGRYFKITDSTLAFYIKVKRVEFSDIFNDYVAIGPIVEFDTRLETNVTLRSVFLLSYDNSTWKEITREDYEKALNKSLEYLKN